MPAGLDVHLVCDNLATHKTPAIGDWLARHPRFHMHFTPTGSSWINQVERWLFVATSGGKLVAVNRRTGRAQSLGFRLPAVDHVAIRP